MTQLKAKHAKRQGCAIPASLGTAALTIAMIAGCAAAGMASETTPTPEVQQAARIVAANDLEAAKTARYQVQATGLYTELTTMLQANPDVDLPQDFRDKLDKETALMEHINNAGAGYMAVRMAESLNRDAHVLIAEHEAQVAEAARLAEEQRQAEMATKATETAVEAVVYNNGGNYATEYESGAYTAIPDDVDYLRRMGVVSDGDKVFTWYSDRVLSGGGLTELNNNGRHVENGLVVDGDGYIAIAAPDNTPIGTVIDTPYGQSKVYDYNSGSSWDIYTDF